MVKKTDTKSYNEFLNEISALTTQALDAAIQRFLKRYGLKNQKGNRPGATQLDTHWVFAQHVIAEFPMEAKDGEPVVPPAYPFKESLKAVIEKTVEDNGPTLVGLCHGPDKEYFPGLVRVIILSATLDFLERNHRDAIKFYNGLLRTM